MSALATIALDETEANFVPGETISLARYPRVKLHSIVVVRGQRKQVGFVMIGGDTKTYERRVSMHRKLARQQGYLPGPYIHATEGAISF